MKTSSILSKNKHNFFSLSIFVSLNTFEKTIQFAFLGLIFGRNNFLSWLKNGH